MNTLEEIQDYYQDLATRHVDLLHDVDGRKAFARFQTDDHITQIRKKATANIVVIAGVNGNRRGDVDDNEIRRGVSIVFATRASTSGNAGTGIDTALEKSEQIMFDFMNKMYQDQQEGCMLEFTLEQCSWDEIDAPWLDNYYGWVLFVPFRGYMPLYNPDKWTS